MDTVTIIKAEYDALIADKTHLEQQVKYLLLQMRLARHRQFGNTCRWRWWSIAFQGMRGIAPTAAASYTSWARRPAGSMLRSPCQW